MELFFDLIFVAAVAQVGTHLRDDYSPAGIRAGVLGSLVTTGIVLGTMKLAGRGLTRLTRRYHQRLAHTIETPI